MDAPPALRLDGISKRYGPRWLLRDLSLTVAPDQTVALCGPNGAGKTTLLRIAACVARAQRGRVEVAGIDARRHGERARAHLAFLPQHAPVYRELTVEEHVTWWARVHGRDVARAAVSAAVEDAGLGRHARERASSLSRGQRQRLLLTMTLLVDAPLLLLDEPFTALDDAGRAWLTSKLAERRGRGACLVAWHAPEAAARLADRTVRLEAGRLTEVAP